MGNTSTVDHGLELYLRHWVGSSVGGKVDTRCCASNVRLADGRPDGGGRICNDCVGSGVRSSDGRAADDLSFAGCPARLVITGREVRGRGDVRYGA